MVKVNFQKWLFGKGYKVTFVALIFLTTHKQLNVWI
jgi:uncharacterized membrane protein